MNPAHVAPDDSEAPQLLVALVRRAEAARASDIHLQRTGHGAEVSFRLDGVLTPAGEIPEPVAERVLGRIKFLARLKTYQHSLPQEGRIDRAELGTASDLRVATYPAVVGEKIVLRLFSTAERLGLDDLGFPPEARDELRRVLARRVGLVLLTGPAGSGKTTTIYACLEHLARSGGRHIITVEDPVEQVIPGIMQTEVNEAAGLDYARAARHLLRQDPEVLVLGEIRDEETARIALRAAVTGHLVISTLHAGSCRRVLERLTMLCPEHHSAVTALELVVNQRLIRRVCTACRGAGCDACFHTGYRGRVPVVEWVRMSDAMRDQVRAQGPGALKPEPDLVAMAQNLVVQGVTSEAEIGRTIAA